MNEKTCPVCSCAEGERHREDRCRDQTGSEYYTAVPDVGTKDDSMKVDWAVHFPVLMEVEERLKFGAQKYGNGNWQKGIKTSRLFSAILRHAFDWFRGVERDEDGLTSLSGIIVNCLFAWHMSKQKEWDDR